MRRRIDAESGLTLVELMISMLLAAMLAGGTFYMMSGQTAAYKQQVHAVSLQENLWGAMEYLQREIRSAGFGFANNCPAGRVRQWDAGAGGNTTMPSRVVGFQVFNDCNLTTTLIGSCPDGGGSDSFVVTSTTLIGESPRLSTVAQRSDVPIVLTATGGIVLNDMLVFSEPGAPWCALVKATSAPVHNPGTGTFNLVLAPDGLYNPPIGSTIFPLPPQKDGYSVRSQVARIPVGEGPRYFAIDRSRGAPRLVSWTTLLEPSSDRTNVQTIGDGVEDMQVSFACDDNDDDVLLEGTAGDRTTDEWAFNIAGESSLPACNPAPVGMVRLSLVVRSESADPSFDSGFRPAAEDRAAGTVADDKALSGNMGTFTRRTLTTLVQPRNL